MPRWRARRPDLTPDEHMHAYDAGLVDASGRCRICGVYGSHQHDAPMTPHDRAFDAVRPLLLLPDIATRDVCDAYLHELTS